MPILEIYDKLIIIGAHFGGWSMWKEAAKELKKFKNLYVDSSSSLYGLTVSEARELIDLYTDDRVLFGTDYPMWSPEDEMKRYKALKLTKKQNEKILFHNANKLFNIGL